MSGGSDTTTSTSAAPPWVQDYSNNYLNKANDVSNTPYNQSPNTAIDPNAAQTTAWNAIQNRALSGSPVQGAANQTLQNTLQGGFLNGNPYLDQMVNKAQGDLVRNYNNVTGPAIDAAGVRSGSFGNSGVASTALDSQNQLQQNMANIDMQMRGQNYATERQNQQSALGFAPQYAANDYQDANQLLQAGNQQGQFAQNQANQNLNWWQQAQQYPTQQLNNMGTALNNVMGTSKTQTTTTPGPSTGAQIGGYGALIGSLLQQFGK